MGSKNLVVVVEDDVVQRLQAVELFELAGLTVQACATGDEAIAFVSEHEAEVACVFTDLGLGEGANGMDVVRSVLGALPTTTMVLTSGLRTERPGDLPANVRFIAKPWQPSDVMAAARDTGAV